MNFTPATRDGIARPELTGTGICQASNDTETCGQPSAALMTTGCEHEHVSTDELCGGCAEHFGRGTLTCLWCGARRELVSMTEISPEPGEEVLIG